MYSPIGVDLKSFAGTIFALPSDFLSSRLEPEDAFDISLVFDVLFYLVSLHATKKDARIKAVASKVIFFISFTLSN